VATWTRTNRPFFPPLPLKVKKVLVAEVHANLIQVIFERDGRAEAEIIRFGAGFVRELLRLDCAVDARKNPRDLCRHPVHRWTRC